MIKSPRAHANPKKEEDLSKHRRKGVPLKSIRAYNLATNEIADADAAKTAAEGNAAEGTPADGAPAALAPAALAPAPSADDTAVLSQTGGARRRKPTAPARSL